MNICYKERFYGVVRCLVDKAAVIEPDHPTLIPGIHVVRGEKGL